MAGSSSNRPSPPPDSWRNRTRTWFIGLAVRDGAALLRRLTPTPDGVRLLHDLDLHMTLAFLGRTTFSTAERAWDAFRIPLLSLAGKPPELVAASVVPMGAVTRFSALAVVPVQDAEVRRVAQVIRQGADALAAFGVSLHRDGPRPHVTVARISRKASMNVRHCAVEWAMAQQIAGVPLRFGAPMLYCRDPDAAAGPFYRGVLRFSS